MIIKDHIGNIQLLELSKTAFLCSRKVPASAVLKCYDWAITQREAGNCIISGFHSQLERDVFHYLEKGTQPIIIAMARGIPDKLPEKLKKPVDDGRILIISPFNKDIKKVTVETAYIRNKLMIDIADKVTVGYADPKGKLSQILLNANKNIIYL
ncbi:MAG: hypothetical protein Q7T72_11790 [Bacteroidales bacterium]|nr:hypothetical protein [Bacteroidales bacterium]